MTLTPFFLSELISAAGSDLIAAYPCVDVTAASRISSLTDYSGNARTLSAVGTSTDKPLGELSSLNGYPSVKHAGEKPLLYSPSLPTVKDIWIMCRYDGAANFGATYRGLVSGETTGEGLVGDGSGTSTKFFNYSESVYYKSQTALTSSTAEAPFTKFEVVRFGDSTGFAFDGLQIGQHADYDGVAHSGAAARRWLGRWMDLFVYPALRTTNQARALNLYYDLKYQQWRNVSTTLEFPDPTITGIGWTHFNKDSLPWDDVTDKFEYEDGGEDFNDRTDTPPQRWQITFTGLSYAQRQIFDTFANVARRSRTFNLTDKWGVVNTGVRIETYQSSHPEHKSWNNAVSFGLKKA